MLDAPVVASLYQYMFNTYRNIFQGKPFLVRHALRIWIGGELP